jgi:WD40 repeat protein
MDADPIARAAALAMHVAGITPDNARTVATTLAAAGAATAALSCCGRLCAAPPKRTPRRSDRADNVKANKDGGLQVEIDRLEAKLKQRDQVAAAAVGSSRRCALHAETAETLGLLRGTLEHDTAVRAVAAVPVAQQLAVGLASGAVVVWDASSCARLHTIETAGSRGSAVAAMAHEPSLQLTATACEDGTVQLWDAQWEEFGRIATPKGVGGHTPTALAVLPPHIGSAHGSVCVGYADGAILVWPLTADANRASAQIAAENPGLLLEQATQALHRGRVAAPSTAVRRSGGMGVDVSSLSEDVMALRSSVDALLDAADQLMPLIGLAAGVSGEIQRVPTGERARGGGKGRQRGKELLASVCGEAFTMAGQHEEGVATLRWVEECGALVSGSYDTTLCMWAPRVAARPPPRSVGSGVSVGSSSASSSSAGGGVVWECTQVLGVDDNDVLTQSVRSVCPVNVEPPQAAEAGIASTGDSGALLLASGHGDGRLKLWQVGVDSQIGQAEGHFNDEQDSAVTHVLCINEGSNSAVPAAPQDAEATAYLASASEDGTVKLWTVASLLLPPPPGKGARGALPVATLNREQAAGTKVAVAGESALPAPVNTLALVHAGTVPLLAVAVAEAIDLWQIV